MVQAVQGNRHFQCRVETNSLRAQAHQKQMSRSDGGPARRSATCLPVLPLFLPPTSRSGSETLIVSLRCARGEHVENVPHIVEHDFIVLARVPHPTLKKAIALGGTRRLRLVFKLRRIAVELAQVEFSLRFGFQQLQTLFQSLETLFDQGGELQFSA